MKFLLALTLAGAVVASAQSTPVACTTATLTGTRSLILSGRDLLSTGVFSKTYYGVGSATFDGAGNVTFNLVTSSNQTHGGSQILSGTYTLPPNCAGSLNITTGDTASFTLIPYNSGTRFSLTGQDATYSFTGTGDSPPSVCAESTLSGAYVFSGTGFTLGSSLVSGIFAITGLLQFDGAGAVSGSWSTASNQVQTPDAFTGSYAVSSSCVASATIFDNYGQPDALTIAFTSTDGANFSFVGAFSTNLFEATAHSTFINPGLAVGNAAGVAGGTPPGSLFSVYGFNLSTGQSQPTGFPLPITAANATVVVNSESVPLIYVSPGQINAQMPFDIQPGLATVVVMTGNSLNSLLARSNTVAITVPSTPVPGVYVYGSNHTIAQNYPSYTLSSSSNAAPAGSVVIVYFNGGGPVQGPSSVLTGRATPDGTFPVTASYRATVDGVGAMLDFVGLTPGFVGLYQANLVIPSVPAGDHPLVLTVGGVASNSTTISTK